jgi:tetratricopeptide (TPR) repeat protein
MGANTIASDFFVAGGTLHPDAPSYVKRPADDELFHLVATGKFCYVLTPRQMGKSSLMIRTALRLGEQGVRTAIIDLTKIGTDVSVEQWYLGLVTRLKVQLGLSVDPDAWWAERASLSAVQRFTDFLHDVVLAQINGPVAIFIDEIDTTLNLDFSDDFFAAIRFTYNARASDPTYHRLTFVLLGVTTPADLIKDRSRTPFNIGQGVDLHEFSREDARVLQRGLQAACPKQGKPIFDRIFYWTDGHPYLTQKLCLTVAEGDDGSWTDERVDELVGSLFLSEEARKETNLQFVRDSVNASPQRRRLLTLYRKVYEGKEIPEDERSLDQNRLKLFGLVRAERGVLKVRNEIYRRAFNLDWIKANTPTDWTRRVAIISTLLTIVLAGVIGYSIYKQGQQTAEAQAQVHVDSFQSTTSAEVRITSLAGLLELHDDTDQARYEDRARQLFYQQLSPEEQLALFELANPQAVETQLIAVIRWLYADQEDDEHGNGILRAMAQPLRQLGDDPAAINLATEIEQWLEGRGHYAQRGYQQAVAAYEVAIRLNDHNPGTRFDRGRAFVGLKDYYAAQDDYEAVIRLDLEWLPKVTEAIEGDPELFEHLGTHRDANPDLATHFPTLTPTPTPTNTPTPTPTPTPSPTNTSTPTATPTNTPTPTFTPRPPTPTFTPLPPAPTHTPPPPKREPKPKPKPTNTPPPPPTETRPIRPPPPTATPS